MNTEPQLAIQWLNTEHIKDLGFTLGSLKIFKKKEALDKYSIYLSFCGQPAMLEGPLKFSFVTLSVCADVGFLSTFSSTSKGKPLQSFSNENAMTDFHQTWYVGSGGGTSTTHVVCCHQMCIFNTSYCISDWLDKINKKVKYPEFCMGYIDETWYVGSDRHKYYPHGLSSPSVHI